MGARKVRRHRELSAPLRSQFLTRCTRNPVGSTLIRSEAHSPLVRILSPSATKYVFSAWLMESNEPRYQLCWATSLVSVVHFWKIDLNSPVV
jgi:hypothetical protein